MAAQAALYGGMAALDIAGGYFASQNIKETARLNQDIANMNSEYAELDAFDAQAEGETDEARYQSVIDNTLGQQKVQAAAADIDLSYGSAKSIPAESKFAGEMNLMEIEKNAQEKALGYTTQARNFKMGGVLQSAEAGVKASSAMFSGITSAGRDGLTGYERVSDFSSAGSNFGRSKGRH